MAPLARVWPIAAFTAPQNVPTYSWSVNVVTHELGHNLGSPHTHGCVWNGNNTAIDGCGPAAGYGEGICASGPLPPAGVGGTIMSYCHLVSSGVNFANGFGPQPAALILGSVNNASCLAPCPTPGCGIPTNLTASNVFESSATVSWGAVSGAYTYQLRWQVPPSGPWSEAWSQSTSLSIGNLTPSSTYSFSVKAVCSGAASGSYSAPGQFITLACILGNPCDDGDMYTSNDRYVSGCSCAGEPAPWTLIQKIVAADRAAGDQFGWTVGVDGDYAVIGARTDDQPINNAGSAYLFKRVGGSWIQQQKLVASDAETDDRFGDAVAIHGNYVVVGAHREDHDANGQNMLLNAGAVYVFVRNGDVWSQQQKIVAADRGSSDYFGASLDIHGDRIVVGVSNDGQDASGGNTIDLAGSAYIFVRNGNVWSQEQKIVASDRAFWDSFGQSVAMSGDRIVVSAENEDEDANGSSTMANAGSVYVFARNGGVWTEEQKITALDRATNDLFGVSVDLDGDRLIVGAHYEDNLASDCGAAYIFSRTTGTWTQEQKIQASAQAEEDYFGRSVAIRGGRALIGAYGKDAIGPGGGQVANCGAAYLFALVNGVWQQQFIALAPDRAVDDYFGVSVALDDSYFLVGAYSENEDEFGMNTALSAGSGYFYAHPEHVVVAPRVMLKGPYSGATGLMSDALRTIGPLPLSGPYANMGYTHIGGGGEVATQATLTQSGADAVVDWVVVGCAATPIRPFVWLREPRLSSAMVM
ncbi:MAG: fibronectin type III domain-containing protein [Flavobacteriales bacterium]|nr:fibronectin type III domain-containing protein [Flavobacteriales bacterium]